MMHTKLRKLLIEYHGDSLCGLLSKIESQESDLIYSDGFEFSISDLNLNPTVVRKLRCLSIADFEVAERPNSVFQAEVVTAMLKVDVSKKVTPDLKMVDYIKLELGLSEEDVKCGGDALAELKMLMEGQSRQGLEERLMQAFKFIQVFHDIYSISCPDEIINLQNLDSFDFTGLSNQYHFEKNPWVRFSMGHTIADVFYGKTLPLTTQAKSQINDIIKEYSFLLARWTGRVVWV